MPKLRYSVATSLDGYIAGPNGEFDWITIDPDIDFAAMYAAFGGILMGRRSFEVFTATGGAVGGPIPTYVYSRSLPVGTREGVTFVNDAVPHVRTLKAGPGEKPLWLWGGGEFFRSMAAAGLVDGVDVAVIPNRARRRHSARRDPGAAPVAAIEGSPALSEDRDAQPRVRGCPNRQYVARNRAARASVDEKSGLTCGHLRPRRSCTVQHCHDLPIRMTIALCTGTWRSVSRIRSC